MIETLKKMQNNQTDEQKGRLDKYIQDNEMRRILNKKGIKTLFPIQYETFDLIYQGKDIIAKDRTGSGKTMAFALPVITKFRKQKKFSGKTKFIIVLPTRQLAIQVRDQIQSLRFTEEGYDFRVGAVYGGSNMFEQRNCVEKGLDIIVGTPGRMIDFLQKGVIQLDEIQVTCLDEADEMLRQGFKEDIEKIFSFVKAKKQKTQNLLFSATIPDWIWEISDQYQTKDRIFIDLIKETVRTSQTVQHYCVPCEKAYNKEIYIKPLIKQFIKGQQGRILIFCETKREVNRIGNSSSLPFEANCLHGDIKQFERERTFRKFKSGQINCIIATNVAARGLDFPQIDLILQMKPPKTIDEYIHRSGRTGRAGKPGVCVTLFTLEEEEMMFRFQDEAKIKFVFINENKLKREQNRWQAPTKGQNNYQKSHTNGKREQKKEGRNYKFDQPAHSNNRNSRQIQRDYSVDQKHKNIEERDNKKNFENKAADDDIQY